MSNNETWEKRAIQDLTNAALDLTTQAMLGDSSTEGFQEDARKILDGLLILARREEKKNLIDSVLGAIISNSTGFDTVGSKRLWHVDIDTLKTELLSPTSITRNEETQ